MVGYLTQPAEYQTCEQHGGVRYCAYPSFRHLIDEWQARVEGVLAFVPRCHGRTLRGGQPTHPQHDRQLRLRTPAVPRRSARSGRRPADPTGRVARRRAVAPRSRQRRVPVLGPRHQPAVHRGTGRRLGVGLATRATSRRSALHGRRAGPRRCSRCGSPGPQPPTAPTCCATWRRKGRRRVGALTFAGWDNPPTLGVVYTSSDAGSPSRCSNITRRPRSRTCSAPNGLAGPIRAPRPPSSQSISNFP